MALCSLLVRAWMLAQEKDKEQRKKTKQREKTQSHNQLKLVTG